MNKQREEATVETYGTLVAWELMEKHQMGKNDLLMNLLKTAFTQGAQYGMDRASQIAERTIVEHFAGLIHGSLQAGK